MLLDQIVSSMKKNDRVFDIKEVPLHCNNRRDAVISFLNSYEGLRID